MTKFSITMVSIVAMTGLAMAQQKAPDPKTGSAGGGAAVGAGATVKAGAGTGAGSAGAGAKVDAKAGAQAGAAVMQAPPEKPKPPAEIAAFLKQMGRTMKCTGTSVGPDMKSEVKMTAQGTSTTALDGWWIKGTATITMGAGRTAHRLKIESYQTWDAKISKWRTVGVANDGSVMLGTAEMKDGKYTAMSDMYGGMMGTGKFRETGDMSDPKAGMKMTGEMSTDGKTWTKIYDMTCKK